ncbi:hypothetical protein FQN60_016461, partial [Etheostoma spectabile]
MNEEIEDTFSKRDMPINFPDVQGKRDTVKEQVTEDMLKEVIDLYISETDSISLLDIPSTVVSVDADDAEPIIETISMLRFAGAEWTTITTTVTSWDVYDTLNSPEQDEKLSSPELGRAQCPEAAVDSGPGAERSVSVGSTASTASAASSLKEVEVLGNSLNAESDLQLIMLSEKFQHCLLVMERSILGNIFQPQLAAYRQLPVIEGKDLLAVGYGELGSSNQKPGLVCCWSLKNPTWPERVIRCDSAVTSLDFSSNNPSQLAVGMKDGSIAIYNVKSRDNKACFISSSGCPNRHLDPVWQLRWTQQELSLTGEEKVESLFSVAADGRISKWFVSNNGLDCIGSQCLLGWYMGRSHPQMLLFQQSAVSGDVQEALFEKIREKFSNGHIYAPQCPVNRVTWSPLSPDVFLSCSVDWTLQLWKQDHRKPVLGFTSTHRTVCDVKWSPKWATVFGAVNEGQLEIWDLNSSVLDPVIVQPAAAGVTMKSLLFATQTNCVLVGDSDGQVTVYQLRNLSSVGDSSQ